MADEMARQVNDDEYETNDLVCISESENMKSTIELNNLELKLSLGAYGPDDVVPDVHLLDLKLTIDPKFVFIDTDCMNHVFDYDPLIAEIDRLTSNGHYHTQERLITRIVTACAAYAPIQAVEICLKKRPVLLCSGDLGVRLTVGTEGLAKVRSQLRG